MRRPSLAPFSLLCALPLLLMACEPGGGGGGGGSGGSAAYVPVACHSVPVDHAAACAAPCAIDLDQEVTCDDWHFAAPGLHVAPAPDATWLVTSSEKDRMLIRADASGTKRVADDVLPQEFVRSPILAGLSPEGELHLVGFTGQAPDFDSGGLVQIAQQGDKWVSTTIADANGYNLYPTDMNIGADGAPHVWFMENAKKAGQGIEDASGKWSDTDAPFPQDALSPRFALTPAGDPASFGVVSKGQKYELHAMVGGADQVVGGPLTEKLPFGFEVPAGPLPASGPAFVALVQHQDALHVAWPGVQGAAAGDVALPSTAALALVPKCSTDAGSCGTSCHDTASGVEQGVMAMARTGDGALWIGYVVTHLDLAVDYNGAGCNPPGDCSYTCGALVGADTSTSELHVLRLRTDGTAPVEVLDLPIARLASKDAFAGLVQKNVLDMRALGKDLAIGVRTTTAPDSNYVPASVRLLRVDTSKITK